MNLNINKVAEITFYFWIMKILATTLGETAGDMISMTLGAGYLTGLAITFSILFILLILQIKGNKFHPALYWAAIIGTTTVGTEISDFMDRSLNLGYMIGSIILFTSLISILGFWYYKEKSLKVYPITQKFSETMYWVAVLFSNSLGTAFGDYIVDGAKLSYLQGAMVTSGVIAIVLLLHYVSRINAIFLFWLAFIFTRPFGATFGDFLTKPLSHGGLDLGTINASIITAIIFIFVWFVAHKKEFFNGKN